MTGEVALAVTLAVVAGLLMRLFRFFAPDAVSGFGQPYTKRSTLMCWFFLLLCCGGLVYGQQLRVTSATSGSVVLEWSGAKGPVTVVRTSGTASQNLTTTDQGKYEDKSIDRFATYRYRVTASGKSSNEVTAGPPPGGVTNAAPAPKNVDASKYGQASAIAFDQNGDPVVVFEWVDPNGDNDYTKNEVRFVRWSRAEYRWLAPVRVQVVGEINTQNLNPLSIACDRRTGMLVVITPVKSEGAVALLSKDGGAAWQGSPIPGISGQVYATAAASADGKIHLVLTTEDSGGHYLSGPLDDVSSWKDQPLPSESGWKEPPGVTVAVAADRAASPLIAWYEDQQEGDKHRFMVWRPGSKAAVAVETTHASDSPGVAIASGGGKQGLLVAAALDEKDSDHGVWYTQSSDGNTWSKASKLPVDGPRSTNLPMDVALDSRGGAVAVFGSNSGSGSTTCNYPALSRSADGTTWKTCGPGKAEGGDFGPQPATLHIVEAENNKAYVLWQETNENRFQQGMLIWHER